jgi:hypothetical protein
MLIMLQITATDINKDKVKDIESLFSSVPWNGEEIDIKQFKADRLSKKHESTCILTHRTVIPASTASRISPIST